MPELPEVETVARDLRPLITGATIVDATTLWGRTLRGITPDAFADGVAGRKIEAVGRRGKQLVIELSDGAFLTVHLKMTGQLFVVRQGGREDPYVRLVLALEDGREIRFRDIRKFGKIGLYGVHDADPFAAVGPEPLYESFTIRAVRTLRPADERRLWVAIRRVLAEAVIRRGSPIDDYTAPEGDAEMQEHLAVYQRTGEPCLRDRHPIRRIVVGGRATHFCSWCQR